MSKGFSLFCSQIQSEKKRYSFLFVIHDKKTYREDHLLNTRTTIWFNSVFKGERKRRLDEVIKWFI